MTTVSKVIHDYVYTKYTYWSEEIAPPLVEFWTRLQVPEWSHYHTAIQTSLYDSYKAARSTGHLFYLTLRPFAILGWILLQFVWRMLLEHGFTSLQRMAIQTWKFQCSLTRTEVLGEIGLVVTAVALYQLRKWIQRQTYWARFCSWYRGKKERAVQAYTKAVHNVAQVSKLLAMALPHSIFLGGCVGLRVLFPKFVRWMAHDSYVTVILTVWYPLACTLGWVHSRRYPSSNSNSSSKNSSNNPVAKDETTTSSKSSNSNTTKAPSTSLRQRKNVSSTASSTTANTAVPASYSQSNLASTRQGAALTSSSSSSSSGHSNNNIMSPEASTTYWLRYWHVYAVVQAIGKFCSLVPIFGRIVTRYPMFYLLAGELELFFFVWLFGMELLLGNTAKDAFLAEALPLSLIKRHVTPLVLHVHEKISDAVSRDLWHKFIISKFTTTLGLLVTVRMLSERWKNWILHVLEETRVLVLPSITLLMPGFVTQFGVTYVQYVVPSAKSAQAKGDAAKLVYLQYWILHCFLTGFLTWFEGILWWIPFSTHVIFILWSYLVFPQTIRDYYETFETELIVFGVLKGNTDLAVGVEDTKTWKWFNALARLLPRASSDDQNEVIIEVTEPCNEDARSRSEKVKKSKKVEGVEVSQSAWDDSKNDVVEDSTTSRRPATRSRTPSKKDN